MSILEYIRRTWPELTYSIANLPEAVVDPKFPALQNGKRPLYIANSENISEVTKTIAGHLSKAELEHIEIRPLPEQYSTITEHGLLYVPNPYVVPGGRFREMYGWDSYFICLGLLQDGFVDLAKHMADNHLYQIRHYGTVLNANRTYYLTRSQPPFLTRMILAVFEKTKDTYWLAESLSTIIKYYHYWIGSPRLTGTGLSRFVDTEKTPAPEVLASEIAAGQNHYTHAAEYYRHNMDTITDYNAQLFFNKEKSELTPEFFWGDRTMRATGFDPSWRFGPFNVDAIHYNPVCLNSLLYQMEADIGAIYTLLGNNDASAEWHALAQQRALTVNTILWNKDDGLYYDYNFITKKQRAYPFLTTFYPLWTGLATTEQAAKVRNNLHLFEKQGGLTASTTTSGCQWDAPYGWAPLMLIAVQGLRNYGYADDADRISLKFLRLLKREYERCGTLYEKYDVVNTTSEIAVQFGYCENVVGFGWTNAVFSVLYHALSEEKQKQDFATELETVATQQQLE